MQEPKWEELEAKYNIQGYDNSSIIINYKTFLKILEKADKYDSWREKISKGLREA